MKIKSIQIENYRNISALSTDFDDVNIIWGENAQGKTNLLEAIYLFSGAKSFRGARDKELISFNKSNARLKIDFEAQGREQFAQIDIGNKRTVWLNGIKKRSAAELGGVIKTIIFSPDHLNMIKEGPAERRKFVDGALCQIKSSYRNLLKDYNRSLEQRNALLKKADEARDIEPMLEVWNINLASTGAKIIFQRMSYLKALKPYLEEIFSGISNGRESIEIAYIGSDTYDFNIEDIDLKENGEIIPYPQITDVHSGNVIMQTFDRYSGSQYFDLDKCGQVRNCTDESFNVLIAQSRMKPEFTIKLNSTPQVLIMHTHTTESFEPFEREYYDASFSYRTSDENMNVTAIGEEMKVQIENFGIKVIHDTTIHDYPSYQGSYERSAETVRKILSENPDIKVVLDIHRDAITSENDLIAPVTEISGKKAAQIMIVSGCDDGTMNMPDYLQNFRLASLFQQQIESDNPGITRPILFDYRNYNQELTTGSLLIEVGSHGNSIDQVRYTGKLIGKSIGKSLQTLT